MEVTFYRSRQFTAMVPKIQEFLKKSSLLNGEGGGSWLPGEGESVCGGVGGGGGDETG